MRFWVAYGGILVALIGPLDVLGQETGPRLWDRNTVFWTQTFGRVQLTDDWSVHAEFQWRRARFLRDPKQYVGRVGVSRQVHPKVLVRAGYVVTQTNMYGDLPVREDGRPYAEHRAFQMVQTTDTVGLLQIQHQVMLEQRWVAEYEERRQGGWRTLWPLTHRVRYQVRLDHALPLPARHYGRAYVAVYDEVFVNFGSLVGANIIDQNRLYAVVGGTPFEGLRLEGGLFLQVEQTGRVIDGRRLWHRNIGPDIAAYWTLDMR